MEGVDVCVYDAERTQPVPNATCHLLRRRGYGTPGRKTRATQGDARAVCVVFAACYKANTLSLLCWSFVDQQSLSFFACVYLRRVLFGCISSRFESWRFFWLKSWWIELHSRKWLFPVCNKKIKNETDWRSLQVAALDTIYKKKTWWCQEKKLMSSYSLSFRELLQSIHGGVDNW